MKKDKKSTIIFHEILCALKNAFLQHLKVDKETCWHSHAENQLEEGMGTWKDALSFAFIKIEFAKVLSRINPKSRNYFVNSFCLCLHFRDLILFLTRKKLREERKDSAGSAGLGGVYTKKQNVLTEVSHWRPLISGEQGGQGEILVSHWSRAATRQ